MAAAGLSTQPGFREGQSSPGPALILAPGVCSKLLVPGRGLATVLRALPLFHDEEYARTWGLPEDALVLPPARPDQRVIYTVLECQPLFDSSDMTIVEWVQIAQTIERHYEQYDGFVVIHGTDTMAFAASVLSFVLENLQKAVILTGAQVPIHALWSDGRENLLGALLMAGQYLIPEVAPFPPSRVCLFFQNQLFRGNRVTKVDTRRFAAFCSPNLPPLAVVGTDVMSKPGREQGQLARASVLVSCREWGCGGLGWGVSPQSGESMVLSSSLGCGEAGAAWRGWVAGEPRWGAQQVAPAGSCGIDPKEERVGLTAPHVSPSPVALSPGVPLINRELVQRVRGKGQLVVHSSMEQDVGLLRLYPGIPASLVRAFLQPPLKGMVMETFGSGNGPTKPELLQELQAAARRGLVIINCTHCLQGTVTSDYAASRAMAGAGIVSGFDMTSEAALAKLSYVLGQPGLSLDSRKELLARDLRGEMTLPTVDVCQPSLQHSLLGRGVTQLLSLSQEAPAVRDALMPSLACAAAHAGDLEALQVLVELGSDLSLEDFNGQTPLHVAARGGHAGVVTMLLQRGMDVNARDKDGLSPLLLAVRGRHQCVVGLLRAAGACLSPQELEDTGTELCR
ncbi:hypothetical protein MC885_006940 [Smutsia gigantea]|nr:hypothetical protein MC885_006940 [Smutsia gigantea]